jgi:hypothetical protein
LLFRHKHREDNGTVKATGVFMPGDLDDRTDLQQADVTAIVNLGLIMSDDRTDLR